MACGRGPLGSYDYFSIILNCTPPQENWLVAREMSFVSMYLRDLGHVWAHFPYM